ncbi:MAG: exopolysaccharide biosynthesis polyprenyl glycosylphosphotransferase [Verrucomicrobiales bacterium]|nr:exopolysaccharide biosynthesis polyprenyl glycosylphosphotransferase [Verrucomicrobiales bacterium]
MSGLLDSGSGVGGSGSRAFSLEDESRIGARSTRTGKGHRWVVVAWVGDFAMAALGSFLAYYLRFHTGLKHVGLFEPLTMRQYFGHMALGSFSMVLTLGWMGLYQKNALLRSRWQADRILKAVLMWTAGFLCVTVALKLQPPISRIYTLLNGVCVFLLLEAWRGVLTRWVRNPATMQELRQRLLFVGWNEDAGRLWRTLAGDPHSALQVVGMLAAEEGEEGQSPKRLGGPKDLERVLERHEVDVVVAADFRGLQEDLETLAAVCERELVQFKLIPSCFRIFVSGLHLEMIAGTPILGVDRMPLDRTFNMLLKRATDIVGATVGLVLSAPIMAVFCALVWLESRGPVFYRQRRCGMIGQPFEIYKIRSMKLDAESESGARWCEKDDPRRLRVGAFMRRWNIDELPQFWNVLKGQMSLVGPRPERPQLIQSFKHEIPHYNARHHALPGMTGWAQIRGLRGDTDLKERIRCDLWYMENWSWLLDLQIMMLTFVKRDNAY